MKTEIKRPLLDYYGGKWRDAGKIIALFPDHKTFVDPFCGAGSILFRKPISKNEIINDKSKEIFNLFNTLRGEGVHRLRWLLERTPYSRDEYQAARENSDDPVEQARRTVVKSWFGISNSLDCPTNGFRVSVSQGGSTTKPWIQYVDCLHFYSNRLRGVIVENLDYLEILKRYDRPDTLFYLDPPYVLATRTSSGNYTHDWLDEDHVGLIESLGDLKGKVALSGYDNDIYKAIPSSWEKVAFNARGQSSVERIEVVWIKK